jgi:hypothetical protein
VELQGGVELAARGPLSLPRKKPQLPLHFLGIADAGFSNELDQVRAYSKGTYTSEIAEGEIRNFGTFPDRIAVVECSFWLDAKVVSSFYNSDVGSIRARAPLLGLAQNSLWALRNRREGCLSTRTLR